jgi:VWFA-related protein
LSEEPTLIAPRAIATAVVVSMLALATTGILRAQRPAAAGAGSGPGAPPSEPPAVRIDAVVTDRTGRPILDLRASDFELLVNGVVQPIAPGELRPASPSRVFAFFLDEFHVAAGPEADAVREAIDRFIAERMRPGDRAVVLKPLDPVTSLRFTADRDALRAVAATFSGRKGDLAPRTTFEEEFIGRAPAAVTAARAQLVTVALSEIALQIGDAGGDRAAVVFVSDGFPRPAANRRMRIPELQGVTRAASCHHFAVYPLSPARAAGHETDEGATSTLDWIAAQTGGATHRAGLSLADGLARMAEELDSAYALRLVSPAADGRFHRVEVKTTRARAEVRTRPGYWAPLSAESRASLTRSAAPAAPPRVLRRSPLITAWVGLRPRDDGGAQVLMSWDAVPAAAGRRSQPSAVKAVARAAGAGVFNGDVPRAVGDAARVTAFQAPAGRLEVDLQVLDANGALLDTETRDIVVPDGSRPGPLMLEPEFVRARNVREFRDASANPHAVPSLSRSFSRAERLLIRVPFWAREPADAVVGLRVLNRGGQPIRTVERLAGEGTSTLALFDLPLAWLAPGQYYLDFTTTTAQGAVRERVSVRITG